MGFFNFSRLKKRHQNSLNHLRHSYNQICFQISVKHRSLQWLLCSRHWQRHQLMLKGQRWFKKMMFTDAAMMGITQDMILNYMQTRTKPNAQMVISTLGTITDTEVMEWLIYCGYSIIVVNQNEKACSVFFDWWHKLGYEPEEIDRVVKETEAICNKMRQIINL